MSTIDFIKHFPIRTFTKGEQLLGEGDVADSVLAIQTGFIKISSLNNDGSERLLWIAGRYDLAPTEELFSPRGKINFYYTALTAGSAYVINKKDFIAYAKQSPELMLEIATNMSAHYDDLLRRLNSVEQTAIKNKLLHTLSYLAERFSADSNVDLYKLGLKLTHQDIADMVGATRETTSIELQKIRALGLISYDRSSLVIHVDAINDEIHRA